MPKRDASDEQLMAAYQAGDTTAFQALFERYSPALYRLARRRVRADDDARDIVQQTMLQMHRARLDYRPGSRVRPWLFTIALNLVRDHHRSRGRKREQAIADEQALVDPRPLPDANAARDRAAQVRGALATLPEAQRVVIELHWFEECPYDEIAHIVGASSATVRVRAHRGYERLRALLHDHE